MTIVLFSGRAAGIANPFAAHRSKKRRRPAKHTSKLAAWPGDRLGKLRIWRAAASDPSGQQFGRVLPRSGFASKATVVAPGTGSSNTAFRQRFRQAEKNRLCVPA